ncbi:MAG: DUF2225 domain-containing protein [Planctomycetes bacterium]|nr:DUF2225 domain-containing protein [Planctomycetota bacterium]
MNLSRIRNLFAALVLLLSAANAHALQVQDMTLISPINGQPFTTVGIPAEQATGEALVDMGYDDDGCRHSSGIAEYSYYVATCPYSYFSALTAEWDSTSGRFLGGIPPEIKAWVDKEFNSEWQTDFNRSFQSAQSMARNHGQPPVDRKDFVMSQQSIPIEKRYRYALKCYEKRGARPAAIAKTALMGAWALRAFVNVPIGHQQLDGGYEEVNDKVMRHVKEGESFSLAKWLPVYKQIFEEGGLTNEGSLIAGLTYFALELRNGDLTVSRKVLDTLGERFTKMPQNNNARPLLQGLVRERKRMLDEYVGFLTIATDNFIAAIQNEEFTRDDLLNKVLVVGEGLRRTGREAQAIDWYLALSQMIETQPRLRDEIRQQGKAPASDANGAVQMGWMADQKLAQLTKAGVVHPGTIAGPHKGLLNAILFDGLGKPEYVNPAWRPSTGGNQQDCVFMLDLVGKSVLDFNFRLGAWPMTLGELWERHILKDRNRVNRFYDPVKGSPFLYAAPKQSLESVPAKTIIVATQEPIPTNQGDVYFAFLANMKIEWASHPLKPGEVFEK